LGKVTSLEDLASELSVLAFKNLLIKSLDFQLKEVVPWISLNQSRDLSKDISLSKTIEDGGLVKFNQLVDQIYDLKSKVTKRSEFAVISGVNFHSWCSSWKSKVGSESMD
jgi:hypothetical protein